MYADRFQASRKISPGGMAMATGATGLVLLGIATAAPNIIAKIMKDPPLVIQTVPIPRDPPKLQPRRVDKPATKPVITTVDPSIDPPPTRPDTFGTDTIPTPAGSDTGTMGDRSGDGGLVVDPPKLPVLVGSRLDPRYMADFQPYYPPDERRAGREGRVVVRVLIGTDGRVHAVEPVSTTSDSFLEATRRRAIERWRFKPAMRDGVPIETWRQMSVSFRLENIE